MKDELSDVEGLGFKVDEKQQEILEVKRTLKLKVCTRYSKQRKAYHGYTAQCIP